MNRRLFIAGGISAVIASPYYLDLGPRPSVAFADDLLVKDLERASLPVLPSDANPRDCDFFSVHLRGVPWPNERRISGWQFNLEEDDNKLFEFVITNKSDR